MGRGIRHKGQGARRRDDARQMSYEGGGGEIGVWLEAIPFRGRHIPQKGLKLRDIGNQSWERGSGGDEETGRPRLALSV